MNNARILLLGFSCTEVGNGYTKELVPGLKREFPEAEIFRCGLGGLSPPIVSAFLKNLHETKGPFTHVVLEISTSLYAWQKEADPQSCRDTLLDLLLLCNEIDAIPLFLMLHRKSLKPTTVDLNGIIRDVCTETQTEYIDLAEGLAQKYGSDFANSMLRDEVHTNDMGGMLQSDLALWRIIHWVNFTSKSNVAINPRLRRVPISFLDLMPETVSSGLFTRRDYEQNYFEYSSEKPLEIHFDKPKSILGFSFLMGPHGGYLKFGIDGPPDKTIRAYDERCYYTRVGFKFVNGFSGRLVSSLQFQSDSGHEQIELLKGQRDDGPARHRFLDIIELQAVVD